MLKRNQLLKEVCALMKQLEMPMSEVVRMSKLNKFEMNDMHQELTILKNARTVDCAAVDKVIVDKVIVDEVTVDNDIAEYDADYAMMKQYFKRNRDAALLSK